MSKTSFTSDHPHHATQHLRQSETLQVLRKHRESLIAQGLTGWELFEAMSTYVLDYRISILQLSRCERCWHDKETHCICNNLYPISSSYPVLPRVKFLLLIHHKEYYSAGNSGKLLLSILPPGQTEIFIFGKNGDMKRLQEEIAKDPVHSMTLWPGENALSVESYLEQRNLSMDKIAMDSSSDALPRVGVGGPWIRVVVLDGTYSNARTMHKSLKKQLGSVVPPTVRLYPTEPSVFHRAQKSYGASSAKGLQKQQEDGPDTLLEDGPVPVRTSTAEACGLLLLELGGDPGIQKEIVRAVDVNNQALERSLNAGTNHDVKGVDG
eukprot:Nitzschia sp. Nitz4//scaffold134_size62860//25295//26263//NITZ4_006324-RA/size62860-processed-gene-0.29-mRNA-1//1//CDS//3329535484//8184//frame0